jgi:hypothetical protein
MPKAWYPDTTPADLERWKVPSCIACNSTHGQNEEDLLLRLMMCFSNDDVRTAGIPQRVIRSMDPRHARNDRDRRARVARFKEVGRDLVRAPDPSDARGLVPNFGPREPGASDLAIRIGDERLWKFGRKVVRGFVYLQRGTLIPNTHRIETFLLRDDPVLDQLLAPTTIHGIGPGISVRYGHTGEDEVASVLKIQIWNRLNVYATVNPTETLDAELGGGDHAGDGRRST